MKTFLIAAAAAAAFAGSAQAQSARISDADYVALARCAGLAEVFVKSYGAAARTFPARFPLLPLDRIYVRGASVHDPIVLPRRPWSHLSDHAPLAAEIRL